MGSSWQQTLAQGWQHLVMQTQSLWQALLQRLDPMIVQLEPIWSDPLWQFIGLIIAALLLTWLLFKLGQMLWDVLLSSASAISHALGKPVSWLEKRLQARRQRQQQQQAQQSAKWQWLNKVHIRQGIDVIRYLTTRRDWRYRSQWYLLSGLDDSGKSHWVDSVSHTTRTHLLAREKQLISEGSHWRFFDQGAVIEVENERRFTAIVDLLNFYRPERPIDGVILTLSAPQLLSATEPALQRQLGERLYQQLWDIQQKTGFVVPVYIQLTQCDHVAGFEAFWQARSSGAGSEMFGWSNPYRMDEAFSADWIDEAFTSLVDGVRAGQLAASAAGKDIQDIDAFMLFDRELMQLHAPLRAILTHTFTRSSFQDALPLRGIWLSGLVDDRIALTEDFFTYKLWPEANLAYPLEQRRFSGNRVLRRMQYASLATLLFLCLSLLANTHSLFEYSHKAESLWLQISERDDRYCDALGEHTWWLLDSLSTMSEQPYTLAIPASWGGGQLPELQKAVTQRILPQHLFPGLECRLRVKADALRNDHSKPVERSADLKQAEKRLIDFATALQQYQQAQAAFTHLASPSANNDTGKTLRHLLDYLYDTSIPSTIDFESPLIAAAINDGFYDHNIKQHEILEPERQLNQLNHLATAVHERLLEKTLSPPIPQLQRAFLALSDPDYFHSNKDMDEALDNFESWAEFIQHHWLMSGSHNSPCGRTLEKLTVLTQQLQNAGYPQLLLDATLHHFQAPQCDTYLRQRLEKMHISPIGDMFEYGSSGKLVMTQTLEDWVHELEALQSLPLIAKPAADNEPPASGGSTSDGHSLVVAWHRNTLIEALDAILAYQAFQRQWWPSSTTAEEPFYAAAVDKHLQQMVGALINNSQVFMVQNTSQAVFDSGDAEADLAASVNSFQSANTAIKQLMAVLKQQGDDANLALLKNASQRFARQQLKQLDQLVSNDRLYLPLRSPQWASENFAAALFSYSTAAEMDSYLQNQRQRVSYMATLYAKPLVGFLVDTDGVNSTDTVANRWLDTLRDMQRYQRQEPGNHISELETFAGSELVKLSADDCNQWLQQPITAHRSGGLFAARHYRIEQQVRSYCQQFGKNTVIKRYLALAERFNKELAGQFPFASLDQAGRSDLQPHVLAAFLEDYRAIWAAPVQGKSLLQGLDELVDAQPQLALDSWLDFVKQLDQLALLWQQASDDSGALALGLEVEFAALPQQSLGMRQIVQWTLNSGHESLVFPNGVSQTHWTPGDDLQLRLRWASGSEFRPVRNTEHPVQVDDSQRSAVFSSQGRWGLFEWWQRFASPGKGQAAQLTFEVPVAGQIIKQPHNADDTDQEKTPSSYLSKVNLLVSVSATHKGQKIPVTVPAQLPTLAPGIPGDQSLPGGKNLASTQ
ncbi:hypothetical protein CHH28_14615 [Bacterioplanes sanyensis]|uniref:Type VI secretion system component TssM1 N-terminal domain-containing protein n=1 Tax=Bacterioplanes sanyensis TaxID=1249553 RepID=A0A222FM23_9GAMM|nr:type VI secretion system protein [Bacterioplanes sanyensis]ASP39830.1 hypothetical protein CHH28_14615 [Bacterioplanes sanyensis]